MICNTIYFTECIPSHSCMDHSIRALNMPYQHSRWSSSGSLLPLISSTSRRPSLLLSQPLIGEGMVDSGLTCYRYGTLKVLRYSYINTLKTGYMKNTVYASQKSSVSMATCPLLPVISTSAYIFDSGLVRGSYPNRTHSNRHGPLVK